MLNVKKAALFAIYRAYIYLQQNYIKTINNHIAFRLDIETCFSHAFTMRFNQAFAVFFAVFYDAVVYKKSLDFVNCSKANNLPSVSGTFGFRAGAAGFQLFRLVDGRWGQCTCHGRRCRFHFFTYVPHARLIANRENCVI